MAEDLPVDAMLARVRANDESFYEVRAPLTGRIAQAFIREGERVGACSKLFVLAPESAGVADALVGLSRLGELQDLEDVERCVQLFVEFARSLDKGDYAHW